MERETAETKTTVSEFQPRKRSKWPQEPCSELKHSAKDRRLKICFVPYLAQTATMAAHQSTSLQELSGAMDSPPSLPHLKPWCGQKQCKSQLWRRRKTSWKIEVSIQSLLLYWRPAFCSMTD